MIARAWETVEGADTKVFVGNDDYCNQESKSLWEHTFS